MTKLIKNDNGDIQEVDYEKSKVITLTVTIEKIDFDIVSQNI